MIELRTFPGLFVGRRTVLQAEEAPRDEGGPAYACGACRAAITARSGSPSPSASSTANDRPS